MYCLTGLEAKIPKPRSPQGGFLLRTGGKIRSMPPPYLLAACWQSLAVDAWLPSLSSSSQGGLPVHLHIILTLCTSFSLYKILRFIKTEDTFNDDPS